MSDRVYPFTTTCSPLCVCASSRGVFCSLRVSPDLLDFFSMPAILIKKTGEEPGAASLAVTVPVEQVQEAEARATHAYQRRAPLPGVRKGQAPAAPVEKQVADDLPPATRPDPLRASLEA